MAMPEDQPASEPAAPALPDYLTDPDATSKDVNATWRYGKPPDYSNTRKVWAETKQMNHAAASLPQLVENLVKNWEVEASFKPVLSDWRTIDHEKYTFAINGGPPQTAEHMLEVGTYNAIIASNQYYCPAHSDFHTSHKTFKRMMPTFAWEVLEVYSGPPKVAFRWRHWGVMKNDYVGFNDQGEKVTAKAHGGPIDIQGVTVADVDDKVRLQSVMTWFDPLEMFRQIAPNGIVNKQVVEHKVGGTCEEVLNQATEGVKVNGHRSADREHAATKEAGSTNAAPSRQDRNEMTQSLVCPILHTLEKATQQVQELEASLSALNTGCPFKSGATHPGPASGHGNLDPRKANGTETTPAELLETDKGPGPSVEVPYPHPHHMQDHVRPAPGDAVAAPEGSDEAKETQGEMSQATEGEKNGLLNLE